MGRDRKWMRVQIGALVIAGALGSRPALAQETNDVSALQQQIDDARAELSTSDGAVACRPLGSIQRATQKIGASEPGPRGDAARTKEADATKRVREACPDCAIAFAPPQTPSPEGANQSVQIAT